MKTVTALVAQQKNKKRVNLYLDGEYYCALDAFTALSNGLKVGAVVDEFKIAETLQEAEYASALDKATGYLSRSMHTKAQMIKYLKGKSYSGKTIARVIDKLIEYGYVDDEAFAKKYVAEKSRNFGGRKIAFDLKTKGVADAIIDGVIDCGDYATACYQVALKYIKGQTLDLKLRQKAYRYLLGKGFDYDTVRSTLEKFNYQGDEDANDNP